MFHLHLDYSEKQPLEGRPNTKPRDHGTVNADNCWFTLLYHVWGPAWIKIHWNSIWLKVRSHMASHYTWRSMTTYTTWFWRCIGTAFGHFSLGLSQSHGHGSWLVCEVALSTSIYPCNFARPTNSHHSQQKLLPWVVGSHNYCIRTWKCEASFCSWCIGYLVSSVPHDEPDRLLIALVLIMSAKAKQSLSLSLSLRGELAVFQKWPVEVGKHYWPFSIEESMEYTPNLPRE